MNAVNIEIWSDIACPWCWIGKRSLEAAIASSDHEVAIRWRAFELNPDAPADAPKAVDYVARLADKYGTSRDEAEGFIARMVEAGRGRGLEIRFDRIRPSNSFDAHRLLAFAYRHDRQTALKENLFRAYLHEGRSISDPETLLAVATETGLAGSDVSAVLDPALFTTLPTAAPSGPRLRRFARSRILTGQASTPAVRSVAKRHSHWA